MPPVVAEVKERSRELLYRFSRYMVREYVYTKEQYDRVRREYEGAEKIYFDTETSGLDPHSGVVWLAVFLLPNSNIVHVVDLQHCDITLMKDILERATLVGANLSFDLKWLRRNGIRPRKVIDVLIQERVLTAGLTGSENSEYEELDYSIFETGAAPGEDQKKKRWRGTALTDLTFRYFKFDLNKDTTKSFIMHPEAVRRMRSPRVWSDEQLDYAAHDVFVLPAIESKQAKEITKEDLLKVVNLENELVPVISDIEFEGIYVDRTMWLELTVRAELERKRLYGLVCDDLVTDGTQTFLFPELMGSQYDINLSSTKVVKERLASRGINVPNLDKNKLLQYFMAYKDPVITRYVDYKKCEKQVGTYGQSWIDLTNPVTGRVHCGIWQIVDTGRMSSRNPNIHNLPRDGKYNLFLEGDPRWNDPKANPKGKKYDPSLPNFTYRHCFKPRPGYLYVDSDYSQMELRVLAEESGDPALIEIFESGQDLHKATAAKMFNIPIDQVTDDLRNRGKTLNFAIAYGKGPTTLAEDLKLFYSIKDGYKKKLGILELEEKGFPIPTNLANQIPTDAEIQEEAVNEAKSILDAYFKAFPLVKAWLDWASEQPFDRGYSKTLFGRKRYFSPVDKRLPKEDRRRIEAGIRNRGKNSPVQGLNADITKRAMIRLANRFLNDGWYAWIVNVIHDEILVEVREDQAADVAKIVSAEMVNAAEEIMHKVPIVAEPVVADRWAKA